MENSNSNPLMKHFRQPAIYLKLPSQGQYWPKNSLELSLSNTIPVYPMTTKDEILLRTPDALLNGEGIVNVIQSCCPNIKDAWQIPSIDLDPILVAIRVASYGSEMEISSDCPHCKSKNFHKVDLTGLLDLYKMPNFDNVLEFDSLKFRFSPQSYANFNKISMIQFEEARILQNLTDDTIDDELKSSRMKLHMDKLVDLNLSVLTNNTEYIELSDGEKVSNKEHIYEFYKNAATKTIQAVRKKIDELNQEASIPKLSVECEGCKKPFKVDFEFNYSSFFDQKF